MKAELQTWCDIDDEDEDEGKNEGASDPADDDDDEADHDDEDRALRSCTPRHKQPKPRTGSRRLYGLGFKLGFRV